MKAIVTVLASVPVVGFGSSWIFVEPGPWGGPQSPKSWYAENAAIPYGRNYLWFVIEGSGFVTFTGFDFDNTSTIYCNMLEGKIEVRSQRYDNDGRRMGRVQKRKLNCVPTVFG